MKKHGFVIDTNILVPALMSKRGASYKILTLLLGGKFEFHLSVPLVREYESVLKRSELKLTWTNDEIDELIDLICLQGMEKFGVELLNPKEFLQRIGEVK